MLEIFSKVSLVPQTMIDSNKWPINLLDGSVSSLSEFAVIGRIANSRRLPLYPGIKNGRNGRTLAKLRENIRKS